MLELLHANVLDFSYSWTGDIFSAVHHLVKFYIGHCNDNRWMEAKAVLESLRNNILEPLVKRKHVSKKIAEKQKGLVDGDRLQKFPTTDLIKIEVKKAMARIAVIHEHCIDNGILHDLPYDLRLNTQCSRKAHREHMHTQGCQYMQHDDVCFAARRYVSV